MPAIVRLFDRNNNELTEFQAFQLVRNVTVSTERKISLDYKSVSAFESLGTVVPDGYDLASEGDLKALIGYLTIAVTEDVDTQFEERFQAVIGDVEVFTPHTQPVVRDVVQPNGGTVENVGGGRELTQAPKAADRRPGDTWSVVCYEYELTAKKLDFWSPKDKDGNIMTNRRGPEASLRPTMGDNPHPCWPTAWISHMKCDGSRQRFTKPVRVTQQVGDKTFTKKGDDGQEHTYYYVNVTKVEVVG